MRSLALNTKVNMDNGPLRLKIQYSDNKVTVHCQKNAFVS